MTTCQAERSDGVPHADDAVEYVAICVRGHQRRGFVCSACSRVLPGRGPAAVTCAECPEDDPRPRVLIPAGVWDEQAGLQEPLGEVAKALSATLAPQLAEGTPSDT